MKPDEIRAKILEIMRDPGLSDEEKCRRRQELMSGQWGAARRGDDPGGASQGDNNSDSGVGCKAKLDETLKCVICLNLCERPVTAPCQHNFCLGCFKRWVSQSKKTCPTCRHAFPSQFATNARINTVLAAAIRMARAGPQKAQQPREFKRIDNKDRPDEAFTTERAKRTGRANASSGRIMVNIPNDHFGPITAEHDPVRNRGVLVGDWWKDRLDCRQWGAHFPHVAGIAGQSSVGAQSVVLSGGYEDDRDEGEWFLYTGSGGRDLSGNKRTNKVQSFDQEFQSTNLALKMSCIKGLPVRVVRSYKEKRSAYAPPAETPVRYDGIYRILRCWRKPGKQGHLVCRYLFTRCDDTPAPWSSSDDGDKPMDELPEAVVADLKHAEGRVFKMMESPYWPGTQYGSVVRGNEPGFPPTSCRRGPKRSQLGYNPGEKKWGWLRPPAPTRYTNSGNCKPTQRKQGKGTSASQRLLREFNCVLCKGVLKDPISTPCGHVFCKKCLQLQFEGMGDTLSRNHSNGRSLRTMKVLKPCPLCKSDIAGFLKTAQVNRELSSVIQRLKEAAEKAEKEEAGDGEDDDNENCDKESDDGMERGEESDGVCGSDSMPENCNASALPASRCQQSPTKGPVWPSSGIGPSNSEKRASPRNEPVAGESRQPDAALSVLHAHFPEFEKSLIEGMLEDQGWDVDDVTFVLKRMRRQQKAIDRCSSSPTTGVRSTQARIPTPPNKRRSGMASPSLQKKKQKQDTQVVGRPHVPSCKVDEAGEKSIISLRSPSFGLGHSRCPAQRGRRSSNSGTVARKPKRGQEQVDGIGASQMDGRRKMWKATVGKVDDDFCSPRVPRKHVGGVGSPSALGAEGDGRMTPGTPPSTVSRGAGQKRRQSSAGTFSGTIDLCSAREGSKRGSNKKRGTRLGSAQGARHGIDVAEGESLGAADSPPSPVFQRTSGPKFMDWKSALGEAFCKANACGVYSPTRREKMLPLKKDKRRSSVIRMLKLEGNRRSGSHEGKKTLTDRAE